MIVSPASRKGSRCSTVSSVGDPAETLYDASRLNLQSQLLFRPPLRLQKTDLIVEAYYSQHVCLRLLWRVADEVSIVNIEWFVRYEEKCDVVVLSRSG